MVILSGIHPEVYAMKVVYLLIGCLILGVGVYMEVLADVVMLPGESFVRAVVYRWGKEFGSSKIVFDASMTVLAGILSLIFSHEINGVREGTVIAAILVGFFARFIGRHFTFIPRVLFGEKEKESSVFEEEESICIAIGRQYGSGGREIGKKLAEIMSYSFYDEELIQMAAGTTGYSKQYIEKKDEVITNSLIYDLVNEMYGYSKDFVAPEDAIFEAEAKTMHELKQKGNCVIVGRCADQILGGEKNCIRVFLHAPLEERIKRIAYDSQINEKEAAKKIEKIDKQRAEYYHYYAHQLWGMSSNYDVSIDTSMGADFVENVIKNIIEKKAVKM